MTATLTAVPGNYFMPQQRDLQTGAIILLTSQKPPSRQVLDWLSRGLAAAAACESGDSCQQDSAWGQPPAASGVALDVACRTRSPSPMPGQTSCSQHWSCSNGLRSSLLAALLLEEHQISGRVPGMLMLFIAFDAAAAEEAEDGQLPGTSSEAEVIGGAAPVSATSQASDGSNNGRWVIQCATLEGCCLCIRFPS